MRVVLLFAFAFLSSCAGCTMPIAGRFERELTNELTLRCDRSGCVIDGLSGLRRSAAATGSN